MRVSVIVDLNSKSFCSCCSKPMPDYKVEIPTKVRPIKMKLCYECLEEITYQFREVVLRDNK